MNYYLQAFKKYAVFSGRAQRAEYWYFFLFDIIAIFIFLVLGMVIGGGVGILFKLYFLARFVPWLAVLARRLHDTGRSAWMLLALLIPTIGPIWLLALAVLDSQPGDNKYGPNPKGVSSAQVS